MKVRIEEVQKMINYISTNSHELSVDIQVKDTHIVFLCFDKHNDPITIKLFEDRLSMMPRIYSSQILK